MLLFPHLGIPHALSLYPSLSSSLSSCHPSPHLSPIMASFPSSLSPPDIPLPSHSPHSFSTLTSPVHDIPLFISHDVPVFCHPVPIPSPSSSTLIFSSALSCHSSCSLHLSYIFFSVIPLFHYTFLHIHISYQTFSLVLPLEGSLNCPLANTKPTH